MKKVFKNLLYLLVLNLFITCVILRFKNPSLTETQLFEKIPQSFIWQF